MVTSLDRVTRLEKELEEARRELLKEDGERYRILMREMSEAERIRILDKLIDRHERVLFGLEAPEEKKGGASMRAGGSGGDLSCPYCGKKGLTKRGLGLHIIRLHKEEKEQEAEEAA